mgnify:FL=1
MARSGRPVEEAVYWYNNSPKPNGVVPAEAVYRYALRLRGEGAVDHPAVPPCNRLSAGDVVYVKPPNVKCMSTWKTGKVTKVVSEQAVEVDGVNRHVADLRFGWSEAPYGGGFGDECDELADREHIEIGRAHV